MARESLALLPESGVDHEVRTTADPNLFDRKSLLALAETLAALGMACYVLQQCRSVGGRYPVVCGEARDFFRDGRLLTQLGRLFPHFLVRPA